MAADHVTIVFSSPSDQGTNKDMSESTGKLQLLQGLLTD